MYLPTNSELRVSIWRLTNKRQVWYEWYAEVFLPTTTVPLLGAPIPPGATTPRRNSTQFLLSPTASGGMSPLVDAFDFSTENGHARSGSLGSANPGVVLVKIAQTSLHNPGGRSSWIGL
jgi:type II protein arginine methyltransferase